MTDFVSHYLLYLCVMVCVCQVVARGPGSVSAV